MESKIQEEVVQVQEELNLLYFFVIKTMFKKETAL